MLALAAPAATPSERVRDRLLAEVKAEPGLARPALRSPVWGIRRWLTPVLALATLLLAVGLVVLGVENRDLARRMQEFEATGQSLEAARRRDQAEAARARAVLDVLTAPDTLRVTLVAGAAKPIPQGKAFYNAARGLVFYAANLPALPSARAYELWLVPVQGSPIGAGVFNTDVSGNGEVLLPALPAGVAAAAFAVTIEPAAGVPAPTGPKVLIGKVSS